MFHNVDPNSLPGLNHFFRALVADCFLAPDELCEALLATNAPDLFIGGSVDHSSQTITLYTGDFRDLVIPFTAFQKSGEGLCPDFDKFSITDSGLTVRLGKYEASGEALLYEFDPEFRRRMNRKRQATEVSLGASIRRLRKQRGLRRDEFPPLASKTIARMEQNQSKSERALKIIARRLGVRPEELGTY